MPSVRRKFIWCQSVAGNPQLVERLGRGTGYTSYMDFVLSELGTNKATRLLILALGLLLVALVVVGFQFFKTENHQAKLEEALSSQKLTDEQKLLLMEDLQERTKDVAPLTDAEKLKLMQQTPAQETSAKPLSDAEKMRLINQ